MKVDSQTLEVHELYWDNFGENYLNYLWFLPGSKITSGFNCQCETLGFSFSVEKFNFYVKNKPCKQLLKSFDKF